jgi:hypothetical protein
VARSGRRARGIGGGILIAAVALHFALSLPAVHGVRLNDFPAYWGAGRVLLEGHPDRIYSTQRKWFTNLPVVAVLCMPLGWLDYEAAWELWWWVSVACFALVFGLLLFAVHRYFPPLDLPRAALVALVFFAFAPVMRRCLALGQTTPLLVVVFALVYLLAREGRGRWAGLLLGFVCGIKIPPLLLLPLLALRRRLGMTGVAAAVVAAAVLASFVFFGPGRMYEYADRVILDNFGRVHAAFNNQSLDGAFMRLLSDRGLADWVPVPRPAGERLAVYAVIAALAGLLLATGRGLLWPARPPPDRDPRAGSLELELGLGVALMVLVFPIVWIHYYLFLLVPLALLPFWWQQREIDLPPACRAAVVVLFVLGTALAGGPESHENAWYVQRETDAWLRAGLNARPLGALLLICASAPLLSEMARRQRSPERVNPRDASGRRAGRERAVESP